MNFDLRNPAERRGIGLTPMIDVVFLLLVFFMLVSRFDRPVAIELGALGSGTGEQNAPRLVDVGQTDLRLNGVLVAPTGLATRLRDLVGTQEGLVVLRPEAGVSLQRLLDVAEELKANGIENLTVVE